MKTNKLKKNKLPKKFKDRWVKALRSGKYNQGRGALVSFDSKDNKLKHCCLGVAGELCDIPGKDMLKKAFLSHIFEKVPSILREENDLSLKLASFNDDGKSFNWIAGYIERYL